MTQQHVRYLPILEEGRLLGVISFHDIAKAALQQASFENKLLKRYIRHWPDDEGRVS
jgi:CBS domain-containing protein